jgi:hypothetical protein
MGGQACVLYGGAEFSRDTDLVIVSDVATLDRLRTAVADLDAHPIAVPPFEKQFLDDGLAIHFRCRAAGVEGMRLDVMSRIRGLPDFETLWDRRTTIDTGEQSIQVLSLPDLVTAKKTQRDRDWPMIASIGRRSAVAWKPYDESTTTAAEKEKKVPATWLAPFSQAAR